MTGSKFAIKFTQDNWEEIGKNGNFDKTILDICPNLKIDKIKDKWKPHLLNFFYKYASDSGNVPSC